MQEKINSGNELGFQNINEANPVDPFTAVAVYSLSKNSISVHVDEEQRSMVDA